MEIKERIYWNQRTYGTAYKVDKIALKTALISLGFMVPIVLPVPLMIYLSKYIKEDIIIRRD